MSKRSKSQGAHFAEQPLPVKRARKYDYEQNQRKQPIPSRHKKSGKFVVAIVAVLVLALLAGGGVVFWRHRPVSITVNGEQRTVLKRTTYAKVFEGESIATKPGNLVSVSGNVLEEGNGYPYSITVNGIEVPYESAASQPVWGGEKIEFADGKDAIEPHTTEVVELLPKLEFKVAPGTGERGYMVQQGLVQYVTQWGKSGKHEVMHGERTGETAPGKTLEEAQNVVVVAQNIHPDNDQKLVAITFDDGPSYYTEPYLKILDEYGAKATFCIIGEQLADGGPVVSQTSNSGHQIISHSWSHLQLTTLDEPELHHQLADTANGLKECVGHDVRYIRPPYGDIDEQVWLKSKGDISVSVFWTHDSLDWEKPGVEKIVQNSTLAMKPGSVILMHDGGGERNQDLEALPQILKAWKDAGYQFVTIEELMASDSSIDMSVVKAGPMPEGSAWPTELATA